MDVMTIIWQGGECTVQDVTNRLPQSAAYTTVWTTLKRLVEKGLLEQKKPTNRILVFSPKGSREAWQQEAARVAAERFLATPNVPRDLLLAVLRRATAESAK
jgi:predicted transcriptional regulator